MKKECNNYTIFGRLGMLFKKFMNYMVMTTLIRRGRKALREMEEKSKHANQNSRDLLMRIVNDNKDTEYGRKYHFADIKSPEDFRKMVPYSSYDDYAPYIERVIDKGEKDLYTVYPIETYALSSGSVGVPKRVPVSAEALDIYSQYAAAKTFATCDNYYKEKTGKHHKFGMGLNTLEVTYQKTSNKDVLPLPDLSVYSNLYLLFHIAKILRVQLGGDVRYWTSYYAPDYSANIGQFAVQDASLQRVKVGNYPIVNVYLNMHLKRCRIYLAMNHVNAGSGHYFWAPHYPVNPRNFHFGVSWNFFN